MNKKFQTLMACVALIVLLSACAPAFAPAANLSLAPANAKSDSAPAQVQPAPAQQTGATTHETPLGSVPQYEYPL